MKVKCGIGNIECPSSLFEVLHRSCEMDKEEKPELWGEGKGYCPKNCEVCEGFDDCLIMFRWDDMERYFPDGLLPKDLAEFLIEIEVNEIPYCGGYSFQEELTLEVGKEKYTVVAYGWPDWDDPKYWSPKMIAYKEMKKDER